MNCLITDRVYGPCGRCGAPTIPAHVQDQTTGAALFCPACCPEHAQSEMKWETKAAVTIEGTQEELF
jgi:hypothetical protein